MKLYKYYSNLHFTDKEADTETYCISDNLKTGFISNLRDCHVSN